MTPATGLELPNITACPLMYVLLLGHEVGMVSLIPSTAEAGFSTTTPPPEAVIFPLALIFVANHGP